MSGCLEKYLPAFVTIISVPSEWNSSHKLFISKSTLAFISPLHNGLDAAACEQEDWTGGGLEAGELPVSLSSSESSGIRCWLFTLLTGALFPVPTFMRRSEIEIKSTDDNERSGKPQERHNDWWRAWCWSYASLRACSKLPSISRSSICEFQW